MVSRRSVTWFRLFLLLLVATALVMPGCKKKRSKAARKGRTAAGESGKEGAASDDERAREEGIVARVGDLVVSRVEWEAETARLTPRGQLTKVQQRNAERQALSALIGRRLVEIAAAKEGIEVSDADVNGYIAAMVKAQGGEENYLKFLAESRQTQEGYREVVHSNLLRAQLRNLYFPEEITEEQMQTYYKSFATNPGRGNKVKVSRVLLTLEPTDHESKWQEATTRIEEIKAEVEAGLPFDEAARKYSQGPYAKRGGNMGWATDKRRPTEVFAPALAMDVGELAGPTRTKLGVQLLTVTQRKNDAAGAYEAERQNIREILEGQRDQRNDRRLYEKLRSQYRVENFL